MQIKDCLGDNNYMQLQYILKLIGQIYILVKGSLVRANRLQQVHVKITIFLNKFSTIHFTAEKQNKTKLIISKEKKN